MEAAAAIIGLIAVGAKVCKALNELISNYDDAPLIAQSVLDEVGDVRYSLSKLQPYVDGSAAITLLGASMTDIDQLSFTLAACVVTFSRLEKAMDSLMPGDKPVLNAYNRLKWTLVKGSVEELVRRLQQHKASLSLLLTILLSESSSEAHESIARFDSQLAAIVSQIPSQSRPTATPTPESSLQPMGMATIPDSGSVSIRTTSSARSRFYQRTFHSTLLQSRPYRGFKNDSTLSLASSQRKGTTWSIFSGGSNTSVLSLPYSGISLSEVPDVSKIEVPIDIGNLYNSHLYGTGPSPPQSIALRNVPSSLTAQAAREAFLRLAIIFAIKIGDAVRVSRILAEGGNVEWEDGRGKSLLHIAVEAGGTAVVDILLDHGADMQLGVYNETVLHLSARNGNKALVELLLDRGAMIESEDECGRTPLHFSVEASHEAVTKLLLDRGADTGARNSSSMTPLHLSATAGDKAVTKLLLDHGADIGATNSSSMTPLHLSATAGDKAVTKLLLDHGADTGATNSSSMTPLHLSATAGHKAVTKLLLDRGADTRARDSSSMTPLQLSSTAGHKAVTKLLLDRAADTGATNSSSMTPLHLSSTAGHEAVTKSLLDRGADIRANNHNSQTPLAMSTLERKKRFEQLLLAQRALLRS